MEGYVDRGPHRWNRLPLISDDSLSHESTFILPEIFRHTKCPVGRTGQNINLPSRYEAILSLQTTNWHGISNICPGSEQPRHKRCLTSLWFTSPIAQLEATNQVFLIDRYNT